MVDKIFDRLYDLSVYLPDEKPLPCTNNLMCERTHVRHKDGCIGKTISINRYMKGL